ncbi:hypothetical protein CFN78_22575 [Amycolatopsis antarctica]|uniref:Uncharacterized protein n=1 Tax=Amycolatopsis antarctica TaxID=1854586 RepID=A0A263CXQ8_9PSEU|nr:hypothetical protein [Amycolatopsis antarctica]OZM70940.1 hypothetical protein CFN78_22575 [Amycolatopsis antarctica]
MEQDDGRRWRYFDRDGRTVVEAEVDAGADVAAFRAFTAARAANVAAAVLGLLFAFGLIIVRNQAQPPMWLPVFLFAAMVACVLGAYVGRRRWRALRARIGFPLPTTVAKLVKAGAHRGYRISVDIAADASKGPWLRRRKLKQGAENHHTQMLGSLERAERAARRGDATGRSTHLERAAKHARELEEGARILAGVAGDVKRHPGRG